MKVLDSLNKFLFGTPEQQLRKFARGICKAMILSVNTYDIYHQKKGIRVRFYSEYAAMALRDRSGWKELKPNLFQHNSGLYLFVKDIYSAADVSILIVVSELEAQLGIGTVWDETRSVVLDECKKVFGGYPDEKVGNVLLDWKNINKELL